MIAGASFGASAWIAFGFYDQSVWGGLAFVWLALLLGLAVARPGLPSGPALAAISGLLLLGVWSLLSTHWAESSYAALVDADRWLFYLAVVVTLLLLLRGRRLERLLLAGAVAPLLVLGGYLLVRMILGDGSALFLNNRLAEPVSYVNGTAAYLLIGVWPLIAVVERARSQVLASAALGAAVVLVSLGAMTQSRGGLAALIISAVLLLAFLPGRLRRGWALLALLAGVGASVPAISDVVAALPAGQVAPSEHSLRVAALTVAGAGAAVGIVWYVAGRVLGALPDRVKWLRGRHASAAVLGAVALAGLLAAALPVGTRVDQVKTQYNDFTQLRQVDPGQARLVSGGGNRYDYWRVAWRQFSDHPIDGVGAGNYDSTYYRERRTTENIRQAHSIELQTLGETGIVGGAALLLFVAGVLAGAWRRSREADDGQDGPAIAVAGGGAFIFWLLHSSVDWIHLIPGVTGIALCGAAAVVAPSMRELAPVAKPARRIAAVSGLTLAVVLACVAISIPVLVSHLVTEGTDELATDPARSLERARQALSVDDDALPAYYLESAALARQGQYEPARAALLEATRREPQAFVPWALLGDLAVRAGKLEQAQRLYRRASLLNPRDPGLSELASSPEAVRRLAASGTG
jgi:hypothetical protein